MLGREGIAGLVCLVLSLGLLALTRDLPQSSMVPVGPGFYPRIVLVLMAALSVMLLVSDVLAGRRGRPAPPPARARLNYGLVAATFGVFVVYVFLLPALGFRLATFLFVAVLQAVLEPPRGWRRWVLVLVVAVLTSWVTHLVFEHYLSVLLPRGRWTGV